MLSESDLDPFFDDARLEWFRFEGHRQYVTASEQLRLRAYLAGEPYDPATEPTGWLEEIRRRTGEGLAFTKVRVVAGPLSDYERWECEWSYPATERAGQRTYILDLSETSDIPALADHDWWMFDTTTVLRMNYADDGTFTGAEHVSDPAALSGYRRLKKEVVAASLPFDTYWNSHPQYWRVNQTGSSR